MSWSIERGHSHTCACGRTYYDSDGQPCHEECVDCGKVFDIDEFDTDYRCRKCAEKHKKV